jgi:hypothetical protein
MKLHSFSAQLSAGVALAFLSCGISNSHAVSATPIQNANAGFSQFSPFMQVSWEQHKIDELSHAYHLLEHSNADYHGHKVEAMHAIKKAAEVLGVELHGGEHHEEDQWDSDRRLREAKRLLEDLASENGGKEQPHIHRALKELDKALATK